MKKLICLFCSVIILAMTFLLGSCGVVEYRDYPALQTFQDGDLSGYMYNGKRYIPTDMIGLDTSENDDICINQHNWTLVGSRWWLNSMKTPVYVNELDENENLLYMPAPYALHRYYVEENFVFPDIYNSVIAKIFVAIGTMDGYNVKNEQRIYLTQSWENRTYNDLVEAEITYIEKESGTWGKWCHVYLELTEYEYFKVLGAMIAEVDDELYMLVKQRKWGERENSSAIIGFDCQKIKPEYCDVFRTAIKELNKMQS